MNDNKEIRCPHCNKLLGIALGKCQIEIKCPRCREVVNYGVDRPNSTQIIAKRGHKIFINR